MSSCALNTRTSSGFWDLRTGCKEARPNELSFDFENFQCRFSVTLPAKSSRCSRGSLVPFWLSWRAHLAVTNGGSTKKFCLYTWYSGTQLKRSVPPSCVSPQCGGYVISVVNEVLTECHAVTPKIDRMLEVAIFTLSEPYFSGHRRRFLESYWNARAEENARRGEALRPEELIARHRSELSRSFDWGTGISSLEEI